MAGNTWIFDLDDTLISNAYLYSNALVCLAIEILNNAHLNFNDVQKKYEEIKSLKEIKKMVKDEDLSPEDLVYKLKYYDLKKSLEIVNTALDFDYSSINKAKKNKFSKERFPKSCEMTYKKYLPKATKKELKKAYEIGTYAFTGDPSMNEDHLPFKEGAEKTMSFLKSKGDKLILLTKGDFEIQNNKIKHKKLEKFFLNSFHNPSIYIVDDKSPFEFLRVLDSERIPPSKRVFSVGNAFYSDIANAVEIGLRGLYIPERKYYFEKIDNKVKFERLYKLDEIVSRYKELTNKLHSLNS